MLLWMQSIANSLTRHFYNFTYFVSTSIKKCYFNNSNKLLTYKSSYNCYSDSKSHTGVSLHLGRYSGSFLSMSKKQSILAESTTVSEFVGTHSAVQKVLWAQNMLTELGYLSAIPKTLFQDNKSTIL